MEYQKPQARPIIMQWGLILGVALILISVIMYSTGMVDATEQSSIPTILNFLLVAVTIWMGVAAYKKLNANQLSLGNAMKIGMGVSLIGGLLSAIYVYVFFTMIDPEMVDVIREAAFAQADFGDATAEQREQAEDMMSTFMSPWFFAISSLVGALLMGLISSLVIGLIQKNN